jgi:hypothetical protein
MVYTVITVQDMSDRDSDVTSLYIGCNLGMDSGHQDQICSMVSSLTSGVNETVLTQTCFSFTFSSSKALQAPGAQLHPPPGGPA